MDKFNFADIPKQVESPAFNFEGIPEYNFGDIPKKKGIITQGKEFLEEQGIIDYGQKLGRDINKLVGIGNTLLEGAFATVGYSLTGAGKDIYQQKTKAVSDMIKTGKEAEKAVAEQGLEVLPKTIETGANVIALGMAAYYAPNMLKEDFQAIKRALTPKSKVFQNFFDTLKTDQEKYEVGRALVDYLKPKQRAEIIKSYQNITAKTRAQAQAKMGKVPLLTGRPAPAVMPAVEPVPEPMPAPVVRPAITPLAVPPKLAGSVPKEFNIGDIKTGAFGTIAGKEAQIIEIHAENKGSGFLEKTIGILKNKGIESIRVPLQSVDSQGALKRLVEKGVLSNPREITDYYPTLFDISKSAPLTTEDKFQLIEEHEQAKFDLAVLEERNNYIHDSLPGNLDYGQLPEFLHKDQIKALKNTFRGNKSEGTGLALDEWTEGLFENNVIQENNSDIALRVLREYVDNQEQIKELRKAILPKREHAKLEQELIAGTEARTMPPTKLGKKNIAEYPGLEINPEESLKPQSTEFEFIDNAPSIGLSMKPVIPKSFKKVEKEIPLEIIKEPKDLGGGSLPHALKGWFYSWAAPVRFIGADYPVAVKISHLGRDTILNLSYEQDIYDNRINYVLKGLNKAQRKEVVELLDRRLTEQEIEALPEKVYQAYEELRIITNEMYEKARDILKIDVGEWNIDPDAYFPHIFVGRYQILQNDATIPGGFARTLNDALRIAREYVATTPSAEGKITIKPKDIGDGFTATLLSRKGFHRFLNEVGKVTELDKDEVAGLMKGVAAIKPRKKFVGNFLKRISNLDGYIDDPELAMKIYTHSVLRKVWLDPFKMKASEWATTLPPGLRQYYNEYIEDVGGKYNPIDGNFVISRNLSKVNAAQNFLKLGYRVSTAVVNRLQPYHTAYAEIGRYVFYGDMFKYTVEGKKVLELSKIDALRPKYFSLDFLSSSETSIWKPLGFFSKSEKANRRTVVAGSYLYAKKVFQTNPNYVRWTGRQYIMNYLTHYSNIKNYQPYQIRNYAELGIVAGKPVPPESAKTIAAIEYAKDVNTDTNYIYDISDVPKLMRQPVGKTVFKFKNYSINYLFQSGKWLREAVADPTPHNVARAIRLISSNVALGGLKLPVKIAHQFLPTSVSRAILLGLLMAAVTTEDEKAREVYKTIYQGVFSTLGIDLTDRISPDVYLPQKPQDLLGVTASDMINMYNAYQKGEKPIRIILQPWILGKDVYGFFDQRQGEITGYRQRLDIKANAYEEWLDALGFTPSKLGITRDVQKIFNEESDRYKQRKSVYTDKIIENIDDNNLPQMNLELQKAISEGIQFKSDDINREVKLKQEEKVQRMLRYVPLGLRRKYYPLIEKLISK